MGRAEGAALQEGQPPRQVPVPRRSVWEGSTGGGGQLPLRLEWLTPAGLTTPNSGDQSQGGHCGGVDEAHGAPGRQGTAIACGCGRRCWGKCPAPPRPPPLRRHCQEPGSSRLPGTAGLGGGERQPLGQRRGRGSECESRHPLPRRQETCLLPGSHPPRKLSACGLYPAPWLGSERPRNSGSRPTPRAWESAFWQDSEAAHTP